MVDDIHSLILSFQGLEMAQEIQGHLESQVSLQAVWKEGQLIEEM